MKFKITYNYSISNGDDEKIETYSSCLTVDKSEILEIVGTHLFNMRTSAKIHLSDEKARRYRIDDVVMTLGDISRFVSREEKKYEFLEKIRKGLNDNLSQNLLPGIQEECLEVDIPNEVSRRYEIMMDDYYPEDRKLCESLRIERV